MYPATPIVPTHLLELGRSMPPSFGACGTYCWVDPPCVRRRRCRPRSVRRDEHRFQGRRPKAVGGDRRRPVGRRRGRGHGGAGRQRAAARRGRIPPRRRGGRRRLGGAHHDEGASGDRRDRVPGRSRGVDRQRDQRRGLPRLSRSSYASSCSLSPSPSRSTHWAPRSARSSRARPRARRCRPPPEASCS